MFSFDFSLHKIYWLIILLLAVGSLFKSDLFSPDTILIPILVNALVMALLSDWQTSSRTLFPDIKKGFQNFLKNPKKTIFEDLKYPFYLAVAVSVIVAIATFNSSKIIDTIEVTLFFFLVFFLGISLFFSIAMIFNFVFAFFRETNIVIQTLVYLSSVNILVFKVLEIAISSVLTLIGIVANKSKPDNLSLMEVSVIWFIFIFLNKPPELGDVTFLFLIILPLMSLEIYQRLTAEGKVSIHMSEIKNIFLVIIVPIIWIIIAFNYTAQLKTLLAIFLAFVRFIEKPAIPDRVAGATTANSF